MRRIGADEAAGLSVLVVCAVVIGLVPFNVPADGFAVPMPLWLLGALAFFAATVTAVSRPARSGAAIGAMTVQVALVIALIATAPRGLGWLPILLVVTAAMSTYVAPRWVTAAVIAVNTVALFVIHLGHGAMAEAVFGSTIYLLLQACSALVSIALQREQRMRTELSVAHTELAAAAVLREETTRASERLRISRELHDLIGHQLTVLTLELESAVHRTGRAQDEHIRRARVVARELLGDVRSTVGELRRRAPDLREALTTIAAAVPQPEVAVTVAGDVTADEEQTSALVRVAQEAVTNAVRHADGATRLTLDVWQDDGRLVLSAVDDGYGPGVVAPGNGLRGVAERVAALGGEITYDGRSGFLLEVRLPQRVAS